MSGDDFLNEESIIIFIENFLCKIPQFQKSQILVFHYYFI
jgi:hypothetical protein